MKNIVKIMGVSLVCSVLYANTNAMAHSSKVMDGTYVKAGVGVSLSNSKFKATNAYDKKALRQFPTYHVGVGYKINDYFRSDVTFQYASITYKSSGPLTTGKQQNIRTYSAFLNGYLDAKIHDVLVPYLTAGIGVGHNKSGSLKNPSASNPLGNFSLPGKNTTNFIYNLGAGILLQDKHFAIDVGYKYMDLGKAKTLNTTTTSTPIPITTITWIGAKQNIRTHQILASLIYKF
jgi:opacity protein-like surface antigen